MCIEVRCELRILLGKWRRRLLSAAMCGRWGYLILLVLFHFSPSEEVSQICHETHLILCHSLWCFGVLSVQLREYAFQAFYATYWFDASLLIPDYTFNHPNERKRGVTGRVFDFEILSFGTLSSFGQSRLRKCLSIASAL